METRQLTTLTGEPLIILLVEDNPSHTELIRRSLQDHRVANHIYHVPDGEAALNYLFQREPYTDPERNPRPHLILLDLRLPKVDGLEVLREIKSSEALRRIPGRHRDHVGGGTRHAASLRQPRQQLSRQTSGLRPIHGAYEQSGLLLAGMESASVDTRGQVEL